MRSHIVDPATRILTTDRGELPIANLNVGDRIFDDMGNPVTITQVITDLDGHPERDALEGSASLVADMDDTDARMGAALHTHRHAV